MTINLKKLQANARRKLQLNGQIEWSLASKDQRVSLGKGFLSTRSTGSSHVIVYSDVSSLSDADVYHELCKAKLYEMGFSIVELAALEMMRECTKDDPKFIRDANSAVAIVMETFANTFLFSFFEEESRTARQERSLRFESSDALTSLHTQLGFWGTAGVSYHLAASNNAKVPFPKDLVEKAIERAYDGQEIRKEYDAINSLLQELPRLQLERLVQISEQDGMQTIHVITRLFSTKTGVEC